eukprot:5123749-Amphidinium_carterae.1
MHPLGCKSCDSGNLLYSKLKEALPRLEWRRPEKQIPRTPESGSSVCVLDTSAVVPEVPWSQKNGCSSGPLHFGFDCLWRVARFRPKLQWWSYSILLERWVCQKQGLCGHLISERERAKVFTKGDVAKKMYFVRAGQVKYNHAEKHRDVTVLEPGSQFLAPHRNQHT